MSTESFLLSLLLHLAALFLVILYASDRPNGHDDESFFDLTQIDLSGAPLEPATRTGNPTQPAPPPPIPSALPKAEEVNTADDQSKGPDRPSRGPGPATQTPQLLASPPAEEPLTPKQQYEAAVHQRLREVLYPVMTAPRTVQAFSGTVKLHVYVTETGRIKVERSKEKGTLVHGWEFCGATEITPLLLLSPEGAQEEENALYWGILEAITRGAPYPAAPPGCPAPPFNVEFDIPGGPPKPDPSAGQTAPPLSPQG